ncbi:MAG: hypothetical protein ACLFTA_03330 [Candidatus Nanohaloarchaea archaeon]
MGENYLGIFAYDNRDLEEIDRDEDPETEIWGEQNDLPTTWQVQLNLTSAALEETRYLTENQQPETVQETLDTGVLPEKPYRGLTEYSRPQPASD